MIFYIIHYFKTEVMTTIQALYGSQYDELDKKGYDVKKGRMYATIMIAAVIMIYFFVIIIALDFFSDDFSKELTRTLRKTFGRSSGKMIGRLIAIPLMALIYFFVSLVFGTKKKYQKSYEIFKIATKKEREKATVKMLMIFLIGLGLLVILGITSLFL